MREPFHVVGTTVKRLRAAIGLRELEPGTSSTISPPPRRGRRGGVVNGASIETAVLPVGPSDRPPRVGINTPRRRGGWGWSAEGYAAPTLPIRPN
jgi:hypothetical protein